MFLPFLSFLPSYQRADGKFPHQDSIAEGGIMFVDLWWPHCELIRLGGYVQIWGSPG